MKQITGLEIPEVSDDLLAQIVRSYNLGPLPISNGRLWKAEWGYFHNVEVTAVLNRDGEYWWAIRDGRNCLSKSGRWQYEPSPSSRTDRFFKYCRFETAQEAIKFYFSWKAKVLARAEKTLKKDPKAILDLEGKQYVV